MFLGSVYGRSLSPVIKGGGADGYPAETTVVPTIRAARGFKGFLRDARDR